MLDWKRIVFGLITSVIVWSILHFVLPLFGVSLSNIDPIVATLIGGFVATYRKNLMLTAGLIHGLATGVFSGMIIDWITNVITPISSLDLILSRVIYFTIVFMCAVGGTTGGIIGTFIKRKTEGKTNSPKAQTQGSGT